jgi:hypothetical protein
MCDSSLRDEDHTLTKGALLMGSGKAVKLSLLQMTGLKAHGSLVVTIRNPCLVCYFNGRTQVKGLGVKRKDGNMVSV